MCPSPDFQFKKKLGWYFLGKGKISRNVGEGIAYMFQIAVLSKEIAGIRLVGTIAEYLAGPDITRSGDSREGQIKLAAR